MKTLLSVLAVFLFASAPASIQPSQTADLIFTNGNVYTVTEKRPHAQAIAVKGDRIVFVGTNAAAKRFQGKNTRVVDLKGATVLPGLADAHAHFTGVGQREMTLNLEGITTLDEFLAKVKSASIRPSPASGSPAAVGSKRSGSRPCFRRVPISTKLPKQSRPSHARGRPCVGRKQRCNKDRGRNERHERSFRRTSFER